MKKLVYFVLFYTNVAISQVGVNVESLSSDFEVNGGVRLRKLDSNVTPSRILMANDKGDIGFVEDGENRYSRRDMYFKMMPMSQINTNFGKFTQPLTIDLKLDIAVVLNPYSETAVFLDYNIPTTSLGGVPAHMQIVLLKNEDNGTVASLQDGYSKATFFVVNSNYSGSKCVSMPIGGKFTDIIVNNTPYRKTVTYSVKGQVDRVNGNAHFGNLKKGEVDFGTGIFIAQVYERKYK